MKSLERWRRKKTNEEIKPVILWFNIRQFTRQAIKGKHRENWERKQGRQKNIMKSIFSKQLELNSSWHEHLELLPGTNHRPGESCYTHTLRHTHTRSDTHPQPCSLLVALWLAPPAASSSHRETSQNAAVTFLRLIKGMICATLTFYLINHLHKAIKSHHLKRFLLVCHVPNRLWYIKEVTWWCILKYGHLARLANFPTFFFFGEGSHWYKWSVNTCKSLQTDPFTY